MKKAYLAGLLASMLAFGAQAEESKKNWDISSELGAIITSGNTETTTFKGGIKAKHDIGSWTNEYKLSGLYKEDEVENDAGEKVTQRTNEKYSAGAQANYNFSEKHSHFFMSLTHDSDYFGAYRNETVASVGYGLALIDDANMLFTVDVGPGYKHFEYPKGSEDEKGNDRSGQTDNEMIAVGKADFSWNITEYAKFTQLAKVEYGETNTKTVSETALLTKINGSMQMKFGFNVVHNSDVAQDKENTDTETVITLVYSF